MHTDPHASMRHVVDRSLVGEASPQEQQSLREHLQACAECQEYADNCRRAIASLSGFCFIAETDLQAKVFASLELRAQQLEAAQPSRRYIARSCIIALLLTIVGSVAVSHVGAPLATLLHLQSAQTQVGLLTLWIAPSWCFCLLLPLLLLRSARSADTKGPTI